MSDELVERLRSDWFGYDVSLKAIDAMEEAADRIEALTAERDHAWAMVAKADTQMCQSLADNLQAKVENNRLRVALDGLLTLVEHANFAEGWCCCGDDMLHHQNPMDCGHTPVDMGEYHASLAIKEARAVMKGDTP